MSLFGQSFRSEVARSDEEDMESYVLQLAFLYLFQSQHKYVAENKCFVTLYLWLFSLPVVTCLSYHLLRKYYVVKADIAYSLNSSVDLKLA